MGSVPGRTRSLRSLGPTRARQHKPRQAALFEAQRAACHVLCEPLRYPLRHPAQAPELILCVRYAHTGRPSRSAGSPLCRIKTSSASCARPGARPPFRRYACPPRWASAPQGAEPVGRAYAGSRSSHGFRPSAVYEVQECGVARGRRRARHRKASACHASCDSFRLEEAADIFFFSRRREKRGG